MTPVLSELGTDPAGVAASVGLDLRMLGKAGHRLAVLARDCVGLLVAGNTTFHS
jgi:hypothetical protein